VNSVLLRIKLFKNPLYYNFLVGFVNFLRFEVNFDFAILIHINILYYLFYVTFQQIRLLIFAIKYLIK